MIYYFPSFTVDGFTTGCHLLGGQFVTSLKSNLCTALPRHNTRENNSINSYAQDKIALQASIVLNWNTLVTGHKHVMV